MFKFRGNVFKIRGEKTNTYYISLNIMNFKNDIGPPISWKALYIKC